MRVTQSSESTEISSWNTIKRLNHGFSSEFLFLNSTTLISMARSTLLNTKNELNTNESEYYKNTLLTKHTNSTAHQHALHRH